jgi:hypothetical protein
MQKNKKREWVTEANLPLPVEILLKEIIPLHLLNDCIEACLPWRRLVIDGDGRLDDIVLHELKIYRFLLSEFPYKGIRRILRWSATCRILRTKILGLRLWRGLYSLCETLGKVWLGDCPIWFAVPDIPRGLLLEFWKRWSPAEETDKADDQKRKRRWQVDRLVENWPSQDWFAHAFFACVSSPRANIWLSTFVVRYKKVPSTPPGTWTKPLSLLKYPLLDLYVAVIDPDTNEEVVEPLTDRLELSAIGPRSIGDDGKAPRRIRTLIYVNPASPAIHTIEKTETNQKQIDELILARLQYYWKCFRRFERAKYASQATARRIVRSVAKRQKEKIGEERPCLKRKRSNDDQDNDIAEEDEQDRSRKRLRLDVG